MAPPPAPAANTSRRFGTVCVLVANLGSLSCTAVNARSDAEPEPYALDASPLSISDADLTPLAREPTLYPATVAPLTWAQLQKLTASDGTANANFGHAVALHGDTALVGAWGDSTIATFVGSAYVFARSASAWSEQQKLIASDGAVADFFGHSVAVSGATALVGAWANDDSGDNSGSSYVFIRSANGWTQEQKLNASDGAAGDRLGISVAVSVDTAIAGANGTSTAGSDTGAAYIFVRDASTWTEEQKLEASDSAARDFFGHSVAVSGDTAIVGAYGADSAGTDSGAAYVFGRNAGTWTQQQKLSPSDGAAYDEFGIDVALGGDTAIVGAYLHDEGGIDLGAAYVFVRNAGTWAQQQKLSPSDGAADDIFGFAVDLGPDAALIGARGDDDRGVYSGSAYIFARNAGSWTEQQKITANDGAANDVFGASVALSAETALVGAPGDDIVGGGSGSAYLVSLRLIDGESCSGNAACASKHCVEGTCCESACDGKCELCAVGGLEGKCTVAPRGHEPTAGCNGYLCSGTANDCPNSCRGDGECTDDHHCRSGAVCLPRAVDGQVCIRDDSCMSGHCVDGICCAQTCAAGCGSCVLENRQGVCMPLVAGHPGAPGCAPYLCTGTGTACPTSCTVHRDCARGNHCADGSCQADFILGAACSKSDACDSGHCADDVCCAAASCGAYRCGPAGACEAACTSNAQCASDHECASTGKCEPLPSQPSGQDASCHLTEAAVPGSGSLHWLALLGLLTYPGFVRRRRPPNAMVSMIPPGRSGPPRADGTASRGRPR